MPKRPTSSFASVDSRGGGVWALLPALALVAVLAYFCLLPLGLLLGHSLAGPDPIGTYASVARRSANWTALEGTLAVSSGAAVLAFVLGLPLGWLVAATDLPGARAWRSLLALPYVIPSYIGAVGWTYLLSGRAGWLDKLFSHAFGLPPLPFTIYSLGGIVFVEGAFFSPFVLMAVAEAVERIDPAVEEAARVCGASPARVLLEITWPLVRRSALGGALLAFLATSASYGVPAVLGPSARPPVSVLTTRIKSYVDLHTTNGFRQATALSAVLLLAALLFPLVQGAASDPRRAGARPAARQPVFLRAWRWPAFLGVALVFSVTTVLPIVALVVSSLMENIGRGFQIENLSLVHWRVVFHRPDILAALGDSFLLAAGAATAATAVGAAIALLVARDLVPGGRLLGAAVWLPYATPGTVLALGVILAFTGGRWGLNLYGTLGMLLVAYAAKYLALAYRMAAAGIEQVHPSMEEAARISGASALRAVTGVLLPMVRGPLIAGWFLVFMPCFGELTMSVLLFGPDTPTLGTTLFELQSYEDPSAASVLAVLIVFVVLVSNVLVRKASGGKLGL